MEVPNTLFNYNPWATPVNSAPASNLGVSNQTLILGAVGLFLVIALIKK